MGAILAAYQMYQWGGGGNGTGKSGEQAMDGGATVDGVGSLDWGKVRSYLLLPVTTFAASVVVVLLSIHISVVRARVISWLIHFATVVGRCTAAVWHALGTDDAILDDDPYFQSGACQELAALRDESRQHAQERLTDVDDGGDGRNDVEEEDDDGKDDGWVARGERRDEDCSDSEGERGERGGESRGGGSGRGGRGGRGHAEQGEDDDLRRTPDTARSSRSSRRSRRSRQARRDSARFEEGAAAVAEQREEMRVKAIGALRDLAAASAESQGQGPSPSPPTGVINWLCDAFVEAEAEGEAQMMMPVGTSAPEQDDYPFQSAIEWFALGFKRDEDNEALAASGWRWRAGGLLVSFTAFTMLETVSVLSGMATPPVAVVMWLGLVSIATVLAMDRVRALNLRRTTAATILHGLAHMVAFGYVC